MSLECAVHSPQSASGRRGQAQRLPTMLAERRRTVCPRDCPPLTPEASEFFNRIVETPKVVSLAPQESPPPKTFRSDEDFTLNPMAEKVGVKP